MTDQPCVGEHSNQHVGGGPIFRIKGNRLAAPAGLFMHLIQAGRALRINRFFQQTRPRYQENRKPGHVPGFFVPASRPFDVRYTPESGHWGNIAANDRL